MQIAVRLIIAFLRQVSVHCVIVYGVKLRAAAVAVAHSAVSEMLHCLERIEICQLRILGSVVSHIQNRRYRAFLVLTIF